MKTIIHFVNLTILAYFLFTSCSKANFSEKGNKHLNEPETYISIDEALKRLSNFTFSFPTKSISEKEIENIITITHSSNNILTKTSDFSTPILYVVNYANNDGYAVLSADTRIADDVLAITDSGNITMEQIDSIEYSDDPKLLPIVLLKRYALSQTAPITDSLIKDPIIDGGNITPIDEVKPVNPEGEWKRIVWETVETENVVPIMLKTEWGQDSPYNDLCNGYDAGCTATAMIQIMAYNCFPNPHIINNTLIPYDTLKTIEHIQTSDTDNAHAIAVLVKNIHDICGTTHIYGTSTLIWPEDAERYFKRIGYENVYRYHDAKVCDNNLIARTLQNGYPTFIAAKANGLNAHSWVIDGLITITRDGKEVGMETGRVYGNAHEFERFFHCNWGWDGSSNGYFLEGIFDTDISYDFDYLLDTKSDSDGDYDCYYRIITYNIPNK